MPLRKGMNPACFGMDTVNTARDVKRRSPSLNTAARLHVTGKLPVGRG